MISNELFWDLESEAPLLNRNGGFLTRDSAPAVIHRARQWADAVADRGPVTVKEWKTHSDNEASQRIFELDAQRTFKDQQYRKDMVETLATIYEQVQDYHQGMGFIVAFLLLLLPKERVVEVVLGLHHHYVPGYFKAAPVSYVRDAKAFEKILEKVDPAVHERITNLVPAEAYCSKWFVGFNVHVLPFKALAEFFEAFVVQDELYRFRFALSLVQSVRSQIMETQDVGKVLSCLRLDAAAFPDTTSQQSYLQSVRDKAKNDKSEGIALLCSSGTKAPMTDDDTTDEPSVSGSFFTNIVENALSIKLDHVDLNAIRESVLEEMAKAEVLRKKREEEMALLDSDDDEIVFSDEESANENSNDE